MNEPITVTLTPESRSRLAVLMEEQKREQAQRDALVGMLRDTGLADLYKIRKLDALDAARDTASGPGQVQRRKRAASTAALEQGLLEAVVVMTGESIFTVRECFELASEETGYGEARLKLRGKWLHTKGIRNI